MQFYRRFYFRNILESPVTEREFLESLQELNHKINFVKEQSFKDAKSCSDVRDVLEKLKIKVGFEMWGRVPNLGGARSGAVVHGKSRWGDKY